MPKAWPPSCRGNSSFEVKLGLAGARTPPHSLPSGVLEFKFQPKTQLWLLQPGYVLTFQGRASSRVLEATWVTHGRCKNGGGVLSPLPEMLAFWIP